MVKRQKIWVDAERTRTASDVQTLAECDAFIRRLTRDIEQLHNSGAGSPSAPRPMQQALYFKNAGLDALHQRREKLLRQYSAAS